jgi:glycosyltransferase involved in cell wall biosynthesis
MEKRISVVIPNYNNAATIGKCLDAAFASQYSNYEIIVVDDKSEDRSVEIIKGYPCKLICLETHLGTSRARNVGGEHSSGEFIFFIDADCILEKDTLSIVNRTILSLLPSLPLTKGGHVGVVIGGTYSSLPYDKGFYNTFQSVFVHYYETRTAHPDYIAAHAMIINAEAFKESKGFPEDFLPIIEDVEFTHRLKRSGFKLVVNPEIQVRHIFNFTFMKSMRNAFRKTKYWVMYSLGNKDLLSDSGCASAELKANVVCYFLSMTNAVLWAIAKEPMIMYFFLFVSMLNVFVSRRLLKTFYDTKGILFGLKAFLFYTLMYPFPVGMGTVAGMMEYFSLNRRFKQIFLSKESNVGNP